MSFDSNSNFSDILFRVIYISRTIYELFHDDIKLPNAFQMITNSLIDGKKKKKKGIPKCNQR